MGPTAALLATRQRERSSSLDGSLVEVDGSTRPQGNLGYPDAIVIDRDRDRLAIDAHVDLDRRRRSMPHDVREGLADDRDDIIRRLKRAGAPSNIVWGAPPDSKGNIALKILADKL